MRSLKVELLRFGTKAGAFQDRYLVAVDGAPVRTVDPGAKPGVEHADVLRALDKLRYRPPKQSDDPRAAERSEAEKQQALKLLRGLIREFLQDLPDSLESVQIDVVTDKVELWALPFEFVQDSQGRDLLGDVERPVLLTRRVRQSFAEHFHSWPETPRVLFAWSGHVEKEAHRAALHEALEPWIGPLIEEMVPDARPILTELQEASLDDIATACLKAAEEDPPRPYTHVHLLAHGAEVEDTVARLATFGVALKGGPETAEKLAKGLRAGQRFGPTVVTLAVCDSSNASNTILAGGQLAYELHVRGVPVVIGSQFPLTEPGAVIHTRIFYRRLLADAVDVRQALCDARAELRHAKIEGHDWVSVTAHLQLPEGYTDQLVDATLRVKLTQLNTASRWAQRIVEDKVSVSPHTAARVEDLLRKRIHSLQRAFDPQVPCTAQSSSLENLGLLASAHKRLAELVFFNGDEGAQSRSREILAQAGNYYLWAHEAMLSHHWSGTQHLAITGVTTGGIAGDRATHWSASLLAAQREASCEPGGDDKKRERVIWALGSIVELYLLRPLLVAPDDSPSPETLRTALERLIALARQEPKQLYTVESTWRQLRRYVHWWTKANGFFVARDHDLSATAAHLVGMLQPYVAKRP